MAGKEKIIDELLKDAPPGQVKEVLKDVKILVGDDALVETVAKKTIQTYDLEHLTQATYENEKGKESTFLLSSHGKVEDNFYFDPSTKKCIKYNHLEQKCEDVREATDEELKTLEKTGDTEELRSRLHSDLKDNYMKDNYPHGTCAAYYCSNSDNIVVCISSTVYKPRSYWSGRWTSQWTLTGLDGTSLSLEGKCDVTTHYFENGNVQFRSNRQFKKRTLEGVKDTKDVTQVVKSVKQCISEEELDYQEELQESLREFAETTFKKLRRQLPLTQLTFPWTTGAASLATELVTKGKGKA